VLVSLVVNSVIFESILNEQTSFFILLENSYFTKKVSYFVLFCFKNVLDIVVFIFLVELAIYHLWLNLKKLTTYEHILLRK